MPFARHDCAPFLVMSTTMAAHVDQHLHGPATNEFPPVICGLAFIDTDHRPTRHWRRDEQILRPAQTEQSSCFIAISLAGTSDNIRARALASSPVAQLAPASRRGTQTVCECERVSVRCIALITCARRVRASRPSCGYLDCAPVLVLPY